MVVRSFLVVFSGWTGLVTAGLRILWPLDVGYSDWNDVASSADDGYQYGKQVLECGEVSLFYAVILVLVFGKVHFVGKNVNVIWNDAHFMDFQWLFNCPVLRV